MLSKEKKEKAFKKLKEYTDDELAILSKMYDKEYDMYLYFITIFKALHLSGRNLNEEQVKAINEYVDNFGKVFDDSYLMPNETYSDDELERIEQAFNTSFKDYVLTLTYITYCHSQNTNDISFDDFIKAYNVMLDMGKNYD